MKIEIIETAAATVIVIPKAGSDEPSIDGRIPESVLKVARLWNDGVRVEEIAKAIGMGSRDNAQNHICSLRRVLPALFPYRSHNQPRKDRQ